ncbi:hypothetical protein EOM09_06495, partial [bacterium]|nr:hypothetical protein [bacterium]
MSFLKENEQKKSKEVLKYIFCFITLISSFIMIGIPSSITGSGILNFYLSEIIGIVSGVYVLIYSMKNFNNITKSNKVFILFTLAFFMYCIVNCIVKIIKGNFEIKSIIIIESNIFVIGFMFLITLKILDLKIALRSISIFSAFLG